MAENDDGNSVPLEEVLVAFKKSLARATLASEQASKYDVQFLLGNRTLYNVGSLNLNLSVGIDIDNQKGIKNDRILLDFSQEINSDKRSNIQFRVDSLPLEPIKGPKVVLARRNKVNTKDQRNEFKVWAVDRQGEPQKAAVKIHVEASEYVQNATPESVIIAGFQTDLMGQLKFEIDFNQSQLIVDGMSYELKGYTQVADSDEQKEVTLQLNKNKEWFLWITQDEVREPSDILPLINPNKEEQSDTKTA
ncbi:MAG TPA: hypothetical protein DCS93_41585 [Microscillaceae bacterium]|nr:hypothetical protein [Microscillaceae bacterium]